MSWFDNIVSILPGVAPPKQKRLPFKEKIKWTIIILVFFFALGNVPLFGLGENGLQQFEYLSIILGASFGSLLSLGIGPIVTGSIILQLLTGAGIVNINYMLYGFPTETKEEFIETMDFLKENEKNIDLVSSSIFGLQKNTIIYNNPKKFGIIKINEEQRTVLEPKITYEVKTGLNQKEASKLRDKYKKTINKINKYPKDMNYFREHMLCKIK